MWFDAFYIALLSETYAGNKWALLRGLFVGLYSNFRAAFNGDYSSKIFVFKKGKSLISDGPCISGLLADFSGFCGPTPS